MLFAGCDAHKKELEFALIDGAGEVVHRERIPATREALARFAARRLGPDVTLALEATTNTWGLVELLQPLVAEVVVSNPLRTRAIAEAKVKTDKVDALVLAQLLRCDYLPRVWIPDAETRARRELTSRRAGLVADRTRIKNRLHSELHRRLIHPPVSELFSRRGLAWLEKLELDPPGRDAVDCGLRQLAALEVEIGALQQTLLRDADQNAEIRLLLTLPGVDVNTAETLRAALGDVTRFADGDHAASYLGLVPSTRQSGDQCYHGPITKQGSGHARWVLVQAAQHLGTHPGPLGVFFRKLAKKKNRNVAVVATARKLVVIAWHMLRHAEPYRYAHPFQTREKLARLRRATGSAKRRGSTKGSPRSAAYGTGKRTRAVPTLAEAYAAEGVPAPRPLAPRGPGHAPAARCRPLCRVPADRAPRVTHPAQGRPRARTRRMIATMTLREDSS
jgi:transposase